MAATRDSLWVWKIPGVPESLRPPVQVGSNLWDANSHDEYERRIKAVSAPDGSVEDRDFMLALGMTADQLINSTGLTDEEILAVFGETREELTATLGLPTEDEVIDFGKTVRCAGCHSRLATATKSKQSSVPLQRGTSS